jgi:hypothetical protein
VIRGVEATSVIASLWGRGPNQRRPTIELPLSGRGGGQDGRQLPEMHNAKVRQPSFRWQRRSDNSLSEAADPLFSGAEHEFPSVG